MEEADTLLLSSFTSHLSSLTSSPPTSLSSLISLNLVYPLTVSILKAADDTFKCDDTLAGGMSKKHRSCTKVAEKIKVRRDNPNPNKGNPHTTLQHTVTVMFIFKITTPTTRLFALINH